MESVIKWQTGVPKENGSYLNTGERLYETAIGQTYWDGFWHNYHDNRSGCKIIAWCKVSDIEPYKE